MRTLLASAFTVACLAFAPASGRPTQAAGGGGDLARLERTDAAMGSWFAIVLYGPDRPSLESAADAAFAEIHRLDGLLSNYRPTSEWSRVNREASRRAVPVSRELFDLLASCLQYSRLSDGAFDITVGPLVKVWGFYKGEGSLPSTRAVAGAIRHVGYRDVRLDPQDGTVRFLKPGIDLDPGGIGKGYAVDRAVAVLKDQGVGRALVSAAGSTIYGLGAPPDDASGWLARISAPGHPEQTLEDVHLKDLSISTSGSYEKFFWSGGRRYAHIIDPRTGYPARGLSSVSVLAPNAIDSEAWTKPYFINGRTWTRANRPAGQRVFACDDTPATHCAWVQ